MKLSISNLAWDKHQDDKVIKLLKKHSVTGIDLAPTKIWPNPTKVSVKEAEKYRQFWQNQGISIIAFQSLLYGHPELTIFQDSKARQNTLVYLTYIIKLAASLGVKALVFGSPRNRQIGNLSRSKYMPIAVDFFHKLAEVAAKHNQIFCIEPNSVIYGCDFIKSHTEAVELVKKINHPAFRLNIDVATITLNKKNHAQVITDALAWSGHFHISERDLKAIEPDKSYHKKVSNTLYRLKYAGWISIEMNKHPKNLLTIDKTLSLVKTIYLKNEAR